MNVKKMYENSWRNQREREAEFSHERKNTYKIMLSLTRYDLALRQAIKYLNNNDQYKKILLDVGCGRGEVIRRFANIADEIIGIDIATVELNFLISEFTDDFKNKVSLIDCDLNSSWPIENDHVNIITCLATLEHLFDPYFIARELSRVCKKNGLLIIEVPNIAYIGYRFSLLLGRFPSTSGDNIGWDGGHLHYFTISDLTKLFEQNGFEFLDVKASGFLYYVRSLRPSLLAKDISLIFRKK